MKKTSKTQLSFQVTQQEKSTAERALLLFNVTNKKIKIAEDYLNIIYNPFSKDPNIDSDQVYNYRVALRKFRDTMVENFKSVKLLSFKCVSAMNSFSFDTQTIKLIKAFINSIEELEIMVDDFKELFSDLMRKNFGSSVITFVDKIKKKCDELDDLISERICPHIKNNILSTSWVNNVGDELEIQIEKKKPIMVELYNKKETPDAN